MDLNPLNLIEETSPRNRRRRLPQFLIDTPTPDDIRRRVQMAALLSKHPMSKDRAALLTQLVFGEGKQR